MNNILQKFVLLLVVLGTTFTFVSCNKSNNGHEEIVNEPVEIKLMKKFGDWNITNGLGLSTNTFVFYVSDKNIKINKCIFYFLSDTKVEVTDIFEDEYGDSKFIYVGITKKGEYKIINIEIDSNEGKFSLKTYIKTRFSDIVLMVIVMKHILV